MRNEIGNFLKVGWHTKVLNMPRFLRWSRITFHQSGSLANEFKSISELTLDCAPLGG